MPHIAIQLSGHPNKQLSQKVSEQVAVLTQEVLHKAPEVIAISIQYVAEDSWWIGGKTLAESGQAAFHLDISITDETNTKAEKAIYLKSVYDTMMGLMPNLHEVSYVHLIDARAAAYGYGGKTQEFRHQHK